MKEKIKHLNKYDILFILTIILFSFFSFYRLGRMTFNNDAHFWYERSTNFINALKENRLAETYQNPKPGVTIMWASGLGMEIFASLYNKFFGFRPLLYTQDTFHFYHFAARFPIVILNIIFLIIFYLKLKNLFDKKVAFISTLFIAFQPFFLTNTRIFHADSTLTVFMNLSAIFLIDYFSKRKIKLLILSGIFAGLSILTKLSGIFLIPYFILLNILYVSNKKININKILKNMLLWFLTTLLTFIIQFPAMWLEPISTIKKIYHEVFFLTQTGRDGINPYYYYLTTLPQYITTFSLVTFIGGLVILIKRFSKLKTKMLFEVLSILSFVLFFFVQMSLTSQKMPRYILPIFPFICIICGLGVSYLIAETKSKLKENIIIFSLIAINMFPILYYFPHYSFYFNKGGEDSFDCSLCSQVGNHINYLENDNNFNVIVDTSNPQRFRPFIKGRYLSSKERGTVETYDYVISDKGLLDEEYEVCKLSKQFDFRGFTYWYIFECD